MKPKTKDRGSLIFLLIMFAFIAIFISLHVAHVATVSQGPEKPSTMSNLPSATSDKEKDDINYVEAFALGIEEAVSNPFDITPIKFKYFMPPFMVIVMVIGIAAILVVTNNELRKQDSPGKEEDSSEWHDSPQKFNNTYMHKYNPKTDTVDKNAILADGLYMNMFMQSDKNIDPNLKKNLNQIVIGGPGTGKSYMLIKPNMAQMNTSCVITDPKGELFRCMAKTLIKKGINVKLFSTADMLNSNCYNPFDYIYDENGEVVEEKVSLMVNLFLKNASTMEGAKKSSGDPFWEKSANAFISSCVYYLLESDLIRKEDKNFTQVFKLTALAKLDESSSSSMSGLDLIMTQHRAVMEAKGVESKAATFYFDIFKLAPSKTADSILISCAVDMKLFGDENVKNLTRTDYDNDRNNVHLEKLGEEQTYLFVNIPAANDTYNFLVSMLYSQLFSTLYNRAEKIYPEKYIVYDKNQYPIVSMIDSEEDAKKIIETIKKGKIVEVKTVAGTSYYQIKRGKKVLVERTDREALERVVAAANSFHAERGGIRMPIHVRCLMDEFPNITAIPQFGKYLSTMRSYEISCTIVIQALSQLKDLYDKRWEEIIADCDTMIFLGANDNETSEYISKKLGDTTIRAKTGTSINGKGSVSSNYGFKKRNLLTPYEVRHINDGGKANCIVMVKDEKPFLVKKASFSNHPNYKITADGNKNYVITQEEMQKYFCTKPVDTKKIVTKQSKQKSLLKVTKNSKFNNAEELQNDLADENVLSEEELENKVISYVPSEANAKHQERTLEGENTVLNDSVLTNFGVSTTNIAGVSADASDSGFYF